MNSPLGKYASLVAAVMSIGIFAAFVFAVITNNASAANALHDFALIAVGAVFGSAAGSAVATNGLGREVEALHKRADAAGLPPATSIGNP